MSEHQYYEFQAIDRPLNAAERETLRAISSRARITATSFVNSYNFGDLKADPLKLLERHFDVFLYTANWGTRQFAMRVPKRLVDVEAIARFQISKDIVVVRAAGEHLIINISLEENDSDEWDDNDESCRLASLAPLRASVLAGDLRLFSLLWLIQVGHDLIADDAIEPAPGLTSLSGPLSALADFLKADPNLLAAAVETATASPPSEPTPDMVEGFIRGLPEDDKVALLVRLHAGTDPHLSTELQRRCRAQHGSDAAQIGPARTAGELRAAALRIVEERSRRAKEKAAAERRRREAAEAQARATRLSALAKRGDAAWRDVEDFVTMRNTDGYDRAATLLVDLRDIAIAAKNDASFPRRLAEIHDRHARKGSFIARLKVAGL